MGQHIPFNPSELQPLDLNNFHAHFALGDDPFPTHMPDGFYRNNFHHLECWDKSYRDALIFLGLSEPADVLGNYAEKSDKRLFQTQVEFYAEIDETVRELEMDLALVQKKINVYFHDSRCKDCEDPRELSINLDAFLSPIYVALRKKGYNPSDLIA